MSGAVTKKRWGKSSLSLVTAKRMRQKHRRVTRRLGLEPLEERRLLTIEVVPISSLPPELFDDPSVLENQSQGGNGHNVSSSGAAMDVLENAKAKFNIMTPATQARRANGEIIEGLKVQPLVTTYLQEDSETGASDAYAAVSLDDGQTWKRYNISESADKSSFNVNQGGGWGGGGSCDDDHDHDGDDAVDDHDHSGDDADDGSTCHSDPDPDPPPVDPDGDPFEGDPTHGGGGGRFCTDDGDVCGTVTKPMVQIKGRNILMAWTSKYASKSDPLKIGEGVDLYLNKGPQRSVLYDPVEYPELGRVPFSAVWVARGIIESDGSVVWMEPEQLTSGRRDALQVTIAGAGQAGFAAVWQEDPAGLRPGHAYGPGDGFSGATVNHKTDIWYSYISWADFAENEHKPPPPENPDGQGKYYASVPMSVPARITDNRAVKVEKLVDGMAPAIYEEVCQKDENGNWIEVDGKAVTKPEYGGKVLKGNTGASRPQIFMQPTKTAGVVTGAEVMIGYEETKGMGAGPPEGHEDGTEPTEEPEPEDIGKYVMYHHFADFTSPDVINSGDILNLPNDKGEYENARRVRFIVQPKGQKGASGTVMVALYRQGEEGKGAPADIFMRRAVNSYAFGNFAPDAVNVSSVTPTLIDESAGTPKVLEWQWDTNNLADESYFNPYDDSRAHRAQLRGDSLVLGYTWTPNWAAARQAHDKYDFFVRRSFDGGQSLTDVKGNPEAPRNVSNLPNSFETVFEPRIMATPKTITKSTGTPTGDAEDVRNEYIFFVSYGTEDNIPVEHGPNDPELPPHPNDIFYARTTDLGETYETIYNPNNGRDEWDWLARGGAEGAQIRMTPAGNAFYATWLQKERDSGGNVTGSDIFFRKIAYPMAFIQGPEKGVRSQPMTYRVSADLPGPYEFDIDWDGDGQIDETATAEDETGVDVVHAYTQASVNTIRVVARCMAPGPDPRTGLLHPQPSFPSYQDVETTVTGVWDDHTGGPALYIGGTTASEDILIGRMEESDYVRINIGNEFDGYEQYTELMQPRVIVFAGDGDDHVATAEDFTADYELHGGGGNDHLQGGKGDDMLFGEAGDDMLHGYQGNDILVGGDGQDDLLGNNGLDVLIGGLGADDGKGDAGNDLVIGGETSYDQDKEMLAAILDLWLTATSPDQLSTYLRVGETVFDDHVTDSLKGGSDDKDEMRDVFFADADGADEDDDVMKDLKSDETVFLI